MKIIEYDSVDSTNLEARRLAYNGAEDGTIVTAKYQTCGRGRLGRQWHSISGGLYMSIIMRLNQDSEKINTLRVTIDAGTALSEILNAKIKWTNDIILNKKKVCGILAESVFSSTVSGQPSSQNDNLTSPEFIILGIGVNILNESFPPDISDKATSLLIETGKETDPALLIPTIYEEIKKCQNTPFGDVLAKYKSRCITINQHIHYQINNKEYTGYAIDIDKDGGLVVITDSETVILHSGEVSVRLASGSYL